jgi:hypothetical protein
MASVVSEVYSGLAEVGYPLSVVSAVVTTFVCGTLIWLGIKIKRGIATPTPIVPGRASPDEAGNLLIGAGVFLAVISWMWVWLASKYKSIAALSGLGGLFTMVSSLVHMRMHR